MKLQILHPNDYCTSNWSGGTTTEVFLYPPGGSYSRREFDYRISTAKVELAQSIFTELNGFKRIILSLDHPLTLYQSFANRTEKIELKPLESYSFSGGLPTTSVGICQDFNLIYSPLYDGSMLAISQSERLLAAGKSVFYYMLQDAQVQINDQLYVLQKGNCLHIETENQTPTLFFDSSNVSPKIAIEVTVHKK